MTSSTVGSRKDSSLTSSPLAWTDLRSLSTFGHSPFGFISLGFCSSSAIDQTSRYLVTTDSLKIHAEHSVTGIKIDCRCTACLAQDIDFTVSQFGRHRRIDN